VFTTVARSGNVGKLPESVSTVNAKVVSTTLCGNETFGSLPKLTVGGGAGVGKKVFLINTPPFIVRKMKKIIPNTIPTHLRAVLTSSDSVWRVSIS
jgi:hypothetical protein